MSEAPTAETQVVQHRHRKPTAAGDKVIIACKIPNGLRLRIFKMVDDREPSPTGYRDIKRAEPVGDDVLIKGTAYKLVPGNFPKHRIIFGYALTEGVDRHFWETWLEQNKDSMMVKNKAIFACTSLDDAEAEAKENEKRFLGLEPMRTDGTDPRRPRRLPGVGEVTGFNAEEEK